jgi:uncharacterized Tic20 family protein
MSTRDQEIRTWSILCHISAFAGILIPFGNVLGPLILWQIKKNDLPEISDHGKESVNFQITMLIVTVIFSIFFYSTLGYGEFMGSPFAVFGAGLGWGTLLYVIHIISWILVIYAAIKAKNGEFFRYPSLRLIK